METILEIIKSADIYLYKASVMKSVHIFVSCQ